MIKLIKFTSIVTSLDNDGQINRFCLTSLGYPKEKKLS